MSRLSTEKQSAWRKANPEKYKEQRRRESAARKARLAADPVLRAELRRKKKARKRVNNPAAHQRWMQKIRDLGKRPEYLAVRRQRYFDMTYNGGWTIRRFLQRKLNWATRRDRQANVPCDLDLEFLLHLWDVQGGICAISGVPMTHVNGELQSASIDRISNAGSHTKDNVQLVCQLVNLGRRTRTDAECKEFFELVRRTDAATRNKRNARSVDEPLYGGPGESK